MGEWISILAEILTLGTGVMNYPAFYAILQNIKIYSTQKLGKIKQKCTHTQEIIASILHCFAYFAIILYDVCTLQEFVLYLLFGCC